MTVFHFSTDDFPEDERIAIWREVFGQKIAGLDMAPPLDQPFQGKVSVKELPNLRIGSIASTANRISRTPHLIDDGSDDLMLGIMFQGQAVVTQKGQGEVVIGPGEAVVWSNSSVGESRYDSEIEFVSVAIPRSVLVPSLINPDRAALSVIPANSEALKLLTGYVELLLREDLPPEMRGLSAAHVQDLVALTLGPGRDAADLAIKRGLRAARLQAVKADIQQNLGNRDLTIDALAIRHGISPRSVRALFALEDTTFTDYVLNQRLARVHRLLTDARYDDRTISSLVFESGFGDLSYFNHSSASATARRRRTCASRRGRAGLEPSPALWRSRNTLSPSSRFAFWPKPMCRPAQAMRPLPLVACRRVVETRHEFWGFHDRTTEHG